MSKKLNNDIAEKSTAFLIDELITTCFRLDTSTKGTVRYDNQTKRFDLLTEAIRERLPEDAGLVVAVVTLVNILKGCWDAQEDIMNTALSTEERLAGAVRAQLFNSDRATMIREMDTFFGEEDRSQPRKTYTYFEENKNE